MEDDLEIAMDKAIYEVLAEKSPGMVASVAALLAQGQSPERIELVTLSQSGNLQTARYVRHIAEHLARTK